MITLTIRFIGMILFSPREQENGVPARMYALLPPVLPPATLPATSPHAGHDHHRHVALLSYDAQHLNGVAGNGPVPVVHSIRSTQLRLPGGSKLDPRVCPDIANVGRVTGTRVDAAALTLQSSCAAQVLLEGGRMTRVAPGVCWEWEGTQRRLAHVAEWSVELDTAEVTFEGRGLRGRAPRHVPSLKPVNGEVFVSILHVLPEDAPPEPGPHHAPADGAEAPHFKHFYDLFSTPGPKTLPRYHDLNANSCAPIPGACTPIPHLGAGPFNCMLSTDAPTTP